MTFAQKILDWFDKYGRHDLPWQKKPTSYRVWISEIMLQQTQVSTVIPYYERFIKKFPNISALASATLDEILQLWSGLGYYARARNLHKTAQIIAKEYKGNFPTDYTIVSALPGIGRSTAGAILSISTKQRFPILDGNVKRILARHFLVSGPINHSKTLAKLWKLSENTTPKNRVHHYTQAIMDLGAMICTRTKPACMHCPVTKTCKAKKTNVIAHYPERHPKQKKPIKATTFVLLIDVKNNAILLEKRPPTGIWGALWSLPECPPNTALLEWCYDIFNVRLKYAKPLTPFRHTFTHFHLDIHPVLCHIYSQRASACKLLNYSWHTWQEIDTLGIPAPVKRLLTTLRNQ